MKKVFLFVFPLLFCVFSEAAIVSYSFTGTVRETPLFQVGTFLAQLSAGSVVEGSLVYNSNAPVSDPSVTCDSPFNPVGGECTGYDAVLHFEINVGPYAFKMDTSAGAEQLIIVNGSNIFSPATVDSFEIKNTALSSEGVESAFEAGVAGFYSFFLRDYSQELYNDTSIPESLLLTDYQGPDVFPNGVELFFSQGLVRYGLIKIDFDSLAPVPIPSAAWLFLSAMGGLIGFKGKLSKRC